LSGAPFPAKADILKSQRTTQMTLSKGIKKAFLHISSSPASAV